MKKHYEKGRGSEKHRSVLRKMSENVGNQDRRPDLAEAMREAGYSESYIRSGHIKDTQSWRNLLEITLPDEMLLKAHKGLLEHKEWRARDAGLEKAYKLKKRYKEEVTIKHDYADLTDDQLEEEMANILAEALELVVE